MEKKVLIIAEMAWAHDGSLSKAINIMKAAKTAGADAIGIHITNLPSYMVPFYGSGEGRVSAGKDVMPIYEYLTKINLNNADWIEFAKVAQEIDIKLCVMPNDKASLKFCEEFIKPTYYVLSPASVEEENFVSELAKTKRPVFFRIGGASLGEIENLVNQFEQLDGGEITLLHGFQNYPTLVEDTNINQIQTLKNLFGLPIGLADHVDGENPFAKVVPVLALASGATVIEKHITWDRAEKGEDFEAALNPADFKQMVDFIHQSQQALGTSTWKNLSDATLRYRNVVRKRAVAAGTLKAGQVIQAEHIQFKRSDCGIAPSEIKCILGRTLKVDLLENEGITLADII